MRGEWSRPDQAVSEQVSLSLAESIVELAAAIRLLAESKPRDEDALLTAEQVGELFGLSPRTLKDQAAVRVFPHHRFGKHYRFSRSDIAEIVRLTGCDALAPTRWLPFRLT